MAPLTTTTLLLLARLTTTTRHRRRTTSDPEPAIRTAIDTAFPPRQGSRDMDVFVGVNCNAPGVFRAVVPMTDHRWRGFCECMAPRDGVCRLDEKRMDAVAARFRAWAYVRVIEAPPASGVSESHSANSRCWSAQDTADTQPTLS